MTLLVVHAAVTWFMVGLIWMVQTVHYPLFGAVGEREFLAYEAQHTRRMGRLLAAPAVAEIVTAAALPFGRPDGVALWVTLLAGALLAGIWVMTALVQAPLHGRLSKAPDPALIAPLVRSNWLRTAAWTARGALVAAMLVGGRL